MEAGKRKKKRWGPFFFFFFFFLLFTFENDENLFWVYQNGNFLPGKSTSRRETNEEKWLCPLRKICLLRPCKLTETLRFLTFRFTHTQTSALASNRSCWQKHKRVHYKIMEIEAKTISFDETQWKRSMICDYITASPWWNVILCKVLECHRSTSLPWKGLSHTSPWISTQSIQCEVVCQYIILTSSLPLSVGDHNHSKYLVSVHEMYLGCVCRFPIDLVCATACYTKDVVYKFLCVCI